MWEGPCSQQSSKGAVDTGAKQALYAIRLVTYESNYDSRVGDRLVVAARSRGGGGCECRHRDGSNRRAGRACRMQTQATAHCTAWQPEYSCCGRYCCCRRSCSKVAVVTKGPGLLQQLGWPGSWQGVGAALSAVPPQIVSISTSLPLPSLRPTCADDIPLLPLPPPLLLVPLSVQRSSATPC